MSHPSCENLRPGPRPRAGSIGRIGLLLALINGCAYDGVVGRAKPRPSAPAADLFDLAGLAPLINAGSSDVGLRAASAWPASGTDKDLEVHPVSEVPQEDTTARLADPAPPSTNPAATTVDGIEVPPGDPAPPAPSGGIAAPIPLAAQPYPIDLSTALRLAEAENPTIGEARVAILETLARQSAAYALLLPSLNAGTNYHGHAGNLLRSSGSVLNISEQSLYVGGGARTVAAESIAIPAVNIASPLTDAIFEPLAARQAVAGARWNAAATANSVLLEVSTLYLNLVGAEATLRSQRHSAAQAEELLRIVEDYAETGQGRKSDADRARADLRILNGAILHAEEEVGVASVRLSERLNLDATVRLDTAGGPLVAVSLVDADAPVADLIREALNRRPDLASRTALVSEAEFRTKEEKARPLLPTVWVGFSGGGFGGGSNLVPPLVGNFAGRTDFDARVYWTLLNFGWGNSALIRRRQAEVGEAVAVRAGTVNLIRSEIGSARADALAQRRAVEVARAELASAEDGFREDRIHLRESLGRPIEVLDSLRLLAGARLNLIAAIVRANQAQFTLFVALGSPPPVGPIRPATSLPLPITSPLHGPIPWPKPEPIPASPEPAPPELGR